LAKDGFYYDGKPLKFDSSTWHVSIWVFTSLGEQFFSSTCKHGMVNQGFWKLSFVGFMLIS
jgi:hypothetical protein